jgi:hypothetical protein
MSIRETPLNADDHEKIATRIRSMSQLQIDLQVIDTSSMAWKRSRVRISPGPPKHFKHLAARYLLKLCFVESTWSPFPR